MGYLVLPAALLSLCKCVCLFVTTSLHPDLQCHAMPDIMYITLPNRENVGLLGSTRIGSRRVIQISAGFMIFFSILGEILLSVQSIKWHWTNFSLVLNSFCGFREIRSAVRLNSIHTVCCYILCIVWLCRYVIFEMSKENISVIHCSLDSLWSGLFISPDRAH